MGQRYGYKGRIFTKYFSLTLKISAACSLLGTRSRYTFAMAQLFCTMMLTSVPHADSAINDLKSRISDLENQYAELFLEGGNREMLKSIHTCLEVLKGELKTMERKLRRHRSL